MSIKKIAEMTGLSTTTVSHAINGTRTVSKQSKELVEKAIAEIGYKPNMAAKMLRTNQSKIIALIIPTTEPNNSTNCFFFDVLNGARERLQQSGYDLMIATYSELQSNKKLINLQLFEKQLVDGVILVPYSQDSDSVSELQKLGIPIVLADRRIKNCNLPCVYSDNIGGTKDSISLLYQNGCRKIGLICGNRDFSTSEDRYTGYIDALKERGLPIDQSLIHVDLPYTFEAGKDAADSLLQNGADAIFCANNMLLKGVLSYCYSMGISIPEDLAIVGFDDIDWMRVTPAPITATYQNPYEIGIQAATLLLETLSGEDTSNKETVLPCELILRSSHQKQMFKL